MKTKVCSRCKQEKPVDMFYRNRSRKDGYAIYCVSCEAEYRKEWNKRRERVSVDRKTCNKCGVNKPASEFFSDRDKVDGLTTFCKPCKLKSNRRWKENNREAYDRASLNYRRRHKAKKSVYDKEYGANRRDNDEEYVYNRRILSGVRHLVQRQYKGSKYEKYLGCSVASFRKHIESQFQEGMSWDNYGDHRNDGWSIDHIIPVSMFDLRSEDDRYKCFHYTNAQPLWWWQNQMKHTKVLNEKELEDLRNTDKPV